MKDSRREKHSSGKLKKSYLNGEIYHIHGLEDSIWSRRQSSQTDP